MLPSSVMVLFVFWVEEEEEKEEEDSKLNKSFSVKVIFIYLLFGRESKLSLWPSSNNILNFHISCIALNVQDNEIILTNLVFHFLFSKWNLLYLACVMPSMARLALGDV